MGATVPIVTPPPNEPVAYRSMEILVLGVAAALTLGACHGDSFRTLPNPGPNATEWAFRATPHQVWGALECVRDDARYEVASEYTPRGQIRSVHGVPSQSHVSEDGVLSSSFVLQVEVEAAAAGDGSRVRVRHLAQYVQNGMSCACPHGSPGRYPSFESVESGGVEEARVLSLLHACLGEQPPAPPYHAPLPASPSNAGDAVAGARSP